MRRGEAELGAFVLFLLMAGCMGPGTVPQDSVAPVDGGGPAAPRPIVSTGDGRLVSVDAGALDGGEGDGTSLAGAVLSLHAVGRDGPEPSVGITSNGDIFFQALASTMRSADHGRTWQRVSGPLTAITTFDPYLWVDPTTDRVFQVNMLHLVCTHIAWTDDQGASWLGNPADCGPVPVNDHIKLGTGPWTGNLAPLGGNPVYPNAVYFAYNKLVAGWMTVSLDGGATFPIASQMFGSGCFGSLHGAITAAPDGAVYVPHRFCPGPQVARSYDNGLTWQTVVVGGALGMPAEQKNPEIAVDTSNNVYLTWVAADNVLHLSVSRNRGQTWSTPVTVTPPGVGSVAFPTLQAGSDGRLAFGYLATTDTTKGAWEAPASTKWHVYYTTTLNGLDANPTFVTVQATPADDPVQRGSICIDSGNCSNGNRNLLDFIDMTIDRDGRAYIAYADGCTSNACKGPNGAPGDSRSKAGMVAIVQSGPSLYAAVGELSPLP